MKRERERVCAQLGQRLACLHKLYYVIRTDGNAGTKMQSKHLNCVELRWILIRIDGNKIHLKIGLRLLVLLSA